MKHCKAAMICLGELAVECTILVQGLAVLLAILPVNALILLLEIKTAVFAAFLLKQEPSQIPTTAGRIFRDPQKQWNRLFVKNCSGKNNTKSWS